MFTLSLFGIVMVFSLSSGGHFDPPPSKEFTMNIKLMIALVNDWNADVSVEDMAKKYGLAQSVVRSRVHALRKKGVNVKSRHNVGVASLTDSEVEKINRSVVKL